MADERKYKLDYAHLKPQGGVGGEFQQDTPFGRAEERMAQPSREDFLEKAIANVTTPVKSGLDVGIRAAAVPIQTLFGGVQRAEALIANPAMQFQELQKNIDVATQEAKDIPIAGQVPFLSKQIGKVVGTTKTAGKALKSAYDALSGEQLGQFGDVYVRAGAPEWLAKTMGLQNFFALTGAAGLVKEKLAGGIGHTDKIIHQQGKNIVTQVEGKLKKIRTTYDEIYKPHLGSITSPDSLSKLKVESQNPKFIQNLINKYSSGVVDQFGNKTVTLDTLRKMFWDVSAKKGKEFIIVKNAVKDAIVRQLPRKAAAEFAKVESLFQRFIDPAYTVLRHLKDKARIKTEVLARFFKNPDHAGSRELLRSLKEFGLDVDDAIKLYTKYATRQAQKKFLGRTAETAVRWGVLSSVLRGKLSGKDDTSAGGGSSGGVSN